MGSTIRDVKREVAERLELPPSCMKIISGCDVLANSHRLEGNAASVQFILVVSHEVLYKCMRGREAEQREAAIKALSRVAQKGSDPAVTALMKRLHDTDHHV